MKAPTPIVITEKDAFETMMEGVPNGEPGLKNDFFERIPFLPKGLGATTRIPSRIASISESDLPSSHAMDFIAEPNILKSLSSIRMKLNDLRESTSNDILKSPMGIKMNEQIPIAKSTEDDIQRILDNPKLGVQMSKAMKTEMEIQKSHEDSQMSNGIPQAHKIESAIKSDHEQNSFDTIIPNVENVINEILSEKAVPDEIQSKEVIESIYETNILSMNINKTTDNSEGARGNTEDSKILNMDEEAVETVTTQQPSLDIFNSTDLVLSKFTLNDPEDEVVTEETLVTSPSETIRPNIITEKDKFSPTAIPTNEEKKKSRRRKFFRKQMRHKSTPKPEADESSTSDETAKSTSRPMLRKLVKSLKHPEAKKITIEEKSNPRKIIFRKGLANNHRRRLTQKTRKDPLVASLLSQIKKQKSQLFRRKNRQRKRPKAQQNDKISSRSKKMKIPIEASIPGAEDAHSIDQMQDMEIMRKTTDSLSSTTVSSATVLPELGNVETTTTIKDSTVENDNIILTTVSVSSSTMLPEDMIKSDTETESKNKNIQLDSSEEDTIHPFSDEINNEVETESPDMYETSTVIATSISTSEAISYFNPENLPKLENF